MKRENFSYILRIVAGLYLFHLAYQLISGHFNGENQGIVPIIAGAAFAIVAVGCVYSVIYGMIKSRMPQESQVEKEFDEKHQENDESEKENSVSEENKDTEDTK